MARKYETFKQRDEKRKWMKQQGGIRGNKIRGTLVKYDLNLVVDQLNEWSKKDDSINMLGFCIKHDYLPDTIQDWEKRYPNFKRAIQLARMRLGERRERLMNLNLLNYGSFARYQSGYDPFLYDLEESKEDRAANRKKGIEHQEQMNLAKLAAMIAKGEISQQ